MTDRIDIDGRLRRAGTAFRDRPVPDVAVRWPSPTHSSRLLAPVAIAAAVALVIAGVAIGLDIRHNAAPTSPATPIPTVPAVPDPNFAVAAPPDFNHGGALSLAARACRVSALRTSTQTRATADGVVGVISVLGGDDCSITADASTIRLLDSHGAPLKVPSSKGNTINQLASAATFTFGLPAGRLRPGTHAPDLAATAARIGFAWTGTYCGPAAASIQITIQGKPVRVPLTGPAPTCRPHASSSLIPGTLGGAGSAVVPPPVSWKALHARLILPSTFTPGPIPLVVVITNTSSEPVALSNPCPTYVARGMLESGEIGAGFGLPDANLCDQPRTLPPGKSVTLTLPAMSFPSTKTIPLLRVKSGDLLRLSWSIAGVPPATATSRIR